MASSLLTTVCVSCGGPANTGYKRVVDEEVRDLWLKFLQKEVQKRDSSF